MPTESAIVLTAIVMVFLTFGVVVAGVDIYSHGGRRQHPAE